MGEKPLDNDELLQLEDLTRRMVATARHPGFYPDTVNKPGTSVLWEMSTKMAAVPATELCIFKGDITTGRGKLLLRERHHDPAVEETFGSSKKHPLLHIPGSWNKLRTRTRQEMANMIGRRDIGLKSGVRIVSPLIAEHVWPEGTHPFGNPVSSVFVAEAVDETELPDDGWSPRPDGCCKLRWVSEVPPREHWMVGYAGDFQYEYLAAAFAWLGNQSNWRLIGRVLEFAYNLDDDNWVLHKPWEDALATATR